MGESTDIGVKEFQQILQNNNGVVIFKFGADWCGPCKKVEPIFDEFSTRVSSNIKCYKIDVDNSFELYAHLKRLKMVKGLPTFLSYNKDNFSFIADDSTIGSDITELNRFFGRCQHSFYKITGQMQQHPHQQLQFTHPEQSPR